MPRQSSTRLREDGDRDEAGGEPDAADPALSAPDADGEAVEPLAGNEAIEADQHPAAEFPQLRTEPKRGKNGVVALIIIAILGMAIGFAAVMLI
jgi:hypothetical protein